MEIFSKRLKELRKEKGLTQVAISKMLGLSQQSYLRYELNKGEPSLETLSLLCKILDTDSDYLIGLKD